MRFFFKIIGSLLVATLLAFLSGWAILQTLNRSSHQIGPWKTNLATGGTQAGLYHRAWVALYGLWAMNSSETIYFFTSQDDQKEPLDCRCDYRVDGVDLDTRWWSLAVYEDFHFIDNPLDRYAINSHTVVRNTGGKWSIFLSSGQKEKNWLPGCAKGGRMALSLRCYNPSEAFKTNLGAQPLPTITKISCR